MKTCIIFGTRPEIIKFSPLIRELQRLEENFFIIHTNQHYSSYMDSLFLEELELPKAKYNLNIGSGKHGEMTGKMLIEIEKVLIKEKPDVILVQGDTNTVLAGALAAVKLHIKIGHVEAGLRSYFKRMPEETNRILADHCSDYLFAPTKNAKDILLEENIPENKIFVTGNTIVDAVLQNLELAEKKSEILNKLKLKEQEFFLVTAHREENVDDKNRLKGIIEGLNKISEEYNLPVIYPIHPRTAKKIKEFEIETGNIRLLQPLGYIDFIKLMKNSKVVLTDSGGIQEETCIMQIPCVTLRDNTERPETLEVGSNILAGIEPKRIIDSVKKMIDKPRTWHNPFGDGTTSKKIIGIIKNDNT